MTKHNKSMVAKIALIDGTEYQIIREYETYFLLRNDDGHETKIAKPEIRQLLAEGLIVDPRSPDALFPVDASHEAFRIQSIRLDVVRSCNAMRAELMTWNETHSALAKMFRTQKSDISLPSIRTLQQWCKMAKQQDGNGLLPAESQRGNRMPRHDEDFEDIVYGVIDRFFRRHEQCSISDVTIRSKSKYLEMCQREKREPNPCGYKIVKRLVEKLPFNDTIKSKIGSKRAGRLMISAQNLVKIDNLLERVELDCTVLDIIVVDPKTGEPIGRPTLCVAIDCASGILVGMQLQLCSADNTLVAKTLLEAMAPKPQEFFTAHGITNRFQAFGTPMRIVTDQGSENSGPLLESIIQIGGIEWHKNIPGSPNSKPFVERIIGTINRFVQKLPGATKINGGKKHERHEQAMKEATLTVADLNDALQFWRYNTYSGLKRFRAYAPLDEHLSPMDCWTRLESVGLVPDPPTPEMLAHMSYVGPQKRTLQRYGIDMHGLQYNSPRLKELMNYIGPESNVRVWQNPTDIRQISVYDPAAGTRFFVPCKSEVPALTVPQLQWLRAQNPGYENENLYILAKQLFVLDEYYSKKSKPSTALRKRKAKAAADIAKHELIEKSAVPPLETPSLAEDGIIARAHEKNARLVRPKSRVAVSQKATKK